MDQPTPDKRDSSPLRDKYGSLVTSSQITPRRQALRTVVAELVHLALAVGIGGVVGWCLDWEFPQGAALAFSLFLLFSMLSGWLDLPCFEPLNGPLVGVVLLACLGLITWMAFLDGHEARIISLLVALFPAAPYAVTTLAQFFLGRF